MLDGSNLRSAAPKQTPLRARFQADTHPDPGSDHRADFSPKRAIAARGAGAKLEKAVIENGALRIWLRTAPEDGKANKAVLAILAKLLAISVRQLEITHGQTARQTGTGFGVRVGPSSPSQSN